MTTAHNIDLPAVLAERLTTTHPDVLRELLATFIHTLMGAEADALCGAGYGERSAERTNSRNGYRHRQFDTRAGTLDLAIPKLLQDAYFPDSLLERCNVRASPDHGGGHLLPAGGVHSADGQASSRPSASPACRSRKSASWPRSSTPPWRPSAPGHWTPAPTRSSLPTRWCSRSAKPGRVVNVHALIAVGVNAEGYREILGIDVSTAEDGAGWLTFWRSLTARGLSGVRLVTSDAHAGLVAAIGATLPGASWQRCRTHYTTNLMAVTPKSSWPWVRTLLHSVFDQPDAESVASAI